MGSCRGLSGKQGASCLLCPPLATPAKIPGFCAEGLLLGPREALLSSKARPMSILTGPPQPWHPISPVVIGHFCIYSA